MYYMQKKFFSSSVERCACWTGSFAPFLKRVSGGPGIVRHADHGDTLLNGYRVPGYPGTQVERVPGYPGTRVPGPSVFMIMDGRSSCMRSN